MANNKDKNIQQSLTSTPEALGDECSGDCRDCSGEACGKETSCCASKDCRRGKLHSFNYLDDIPGGFADSEFVEVQFKNTRKGYYRNSTHLPLEIGDMVAVEASPGHDIGMVTLTGELVELRMRKANSRNKDNQEIRRVFRKAKPADLEKYEESKAREDDTMIRSRQIADSLGLNMKIGDVEYQGDGNKAIFYYISDERVDFRQLIKILADTFKVRIEMRQIGARQEAGRIGGIGPCGRPLCCSLWMTNFVSVSTSAARYQDISMNPQKLAGQCAKLKCCLNFEVDAYVEAARHMPPREVRLETIDATWFHFKSDVFNRTITYSSDKNIAANLVTLTAERVFEIIELNKAGEKPESLLPQSGENKRPKADFGDVLEDGDLARFDKKKKKKKKNPRKPDGSNQSNKESAPNGSTNEQKGPKEPKEPKEPKDTQSPTDGKPVQKKPKKRKPKPRKPDGPAQPQE